MLEISPKSFDEFSIAAQTGSVVPVVRSVLADLHTPVSAFLRIAKTRATVFFVRINRRRRNAGALFVSRGKSFYDRSLDRIQQTIVEKDGDRQKFCRKQRCSIFCANISAENKLARRENLPPLCGGAVGFLAYDAARWFEKVLDDGKTFADEDAVWMFFRTILIFDRLKHRIEIVSIVFTDEAEGDAEKLKNLYEQAVVETEKIEQLLQESSLSRFCFRKRKNNRTNFHQTGKKKIFSKPSTQIKEKILAGDAYQVVLSQKFKRANIRRADKYLPRAAHDKSFAVYVFSEIRRGNSDRRVARNARALSRQKARISTDCRNPKTRRDRNRRLDSRRRSALGYEGNRRTYNARRSGQKRSRTRRRIRLGRRSRR